MPERYMIEEASLKRQIKQLTRAADRFAPVWNRLTNGGKLTLQNDCNKLFRKLTTKVKDATEDMEWITDGVRRARQIEVDAKLSR